jgi:hypothetical protein
MHVVMPAAEPTSTDDHLDLSFRRPDGWIDLPAEDATAGRLLLAMFGHETEGPMFLLAETAPTDADPPRTPAHGHESDTFRISLIGRSFMGPESYGPGEFRWQVGGRPYGADSYANGAEGGYHLVMFGDRRGFPTKVVKKELQPQFTERDAALQGLFGIEPPVPYPIEGRGVATSTGAVDKAGKVNGSFAESDTWDEVAPGLRVHSGVMGHQEVGPLILMARADAGTELLPVTSLATEVLVMVVSGSLSIGDRVHEQGDLRLQASTAPLPAVAAGPDGADVVVIVGDRSALADVPDSLLARCLARVGAAVTV